MVAPVASIDRLERDVETSRARITTHELYQALDGVDDVRSFMEHHVFAVWDFMSLLKALQRELTCVEVPWTPRGDPVVRRFINDIVLGEESDVDGPHGAASHFELYRRAMAEIGAETRPIDTFVALLRKGQPVEDALEACGAPEPAQEFVRATWKVIGSGSTPAIAAAFALGREDPIPDMFTALLADLPDGPPGRLAAFQYYLERHVELDGGHHAGLARRMLENVCGHDPVKWQEATAAAEEALAARAELWDGVVAAVQSRARKA